MSDRNGAWSCPSAWKNEASFYNEFVEHIGDVRVIVELGVHFGYSTFTFARDFPGAVVYGVDNFSFDDSEDARKHLEQWVPHFENIKILEMASEEAARFWKQPDVYVDIDILHIDANHEYDAVKNDFETWSRFVRPGGAVLFHDVATVFHEEGKHDYRPVLEFFESLEGEKKIQQNLGVWYKED